MPDWLDAAAAEEELKPVGGARAEVGRMGGVTDLQTAGIWERDSG